MVDLPNCAAAPCVSCPYRKDVPAGIWDASEYVKLPLFDTDAPFTPGALRMFYCHQQDGKLCAGWIGCHGPDNLLAIAFHDVDPALFDFVSPVPLFASGLEAAEHGLSGVENPGPDALAMIQRLERKLDGDNG